MGQARNYPRSTMAPKQQTTTQLYRLFLGQSVGINRLWRELLSFHSDGDGCTPGPPLEGVPGLGVCVGRDPRGPGGTESRRAWEASDQEEP